MASSALLAADYASLAKEAGRRHSDVRDAADKAHQLVKQSKEQAFDELRTDPPPSQHPLYQPIFLASPTRNAKVIALAMSALQRLIVAGAVPKTFVKQILDTLEQVIPQGVEIQLKILQILSSLLTTNSPAAQDVRTGKLVQGEELGRALELSHRLSTSKIPVVASTASATLRQLFMFVFERVGEEDALVASSSDPNDPSLPAATFDVDIPPLEEDRAASLATSLARKKPYLPGDAPSSPEVPQKTPAFGATLQPESQANETRSMKLRPAARDAYLLLEDLCLLIAGAGGEGAPDGEPSFLRWGSLSRTFGLELVESIVSGFGGIVRTHPELLLVLRAHLCPLLIRFLSSPPHSTLSSSTSFTFSFPLTLRLTRVVFLLLKQFSDLLTLESEVFLTMFVRVIGPGDRGEGEGGHPAGPAAGQNSPLWMRVLALEIFRGLCSDFGLMMKVYQRYDAATREAEERSGAGNKGKGRATPAGGSTVFSDMMTAFNRLATEKPSVLGVGAAVMYGSSLGPVFSSGAGSSAGHASTGMSPAASSTGVTGSAVIDSAMEMGYGLAQAAGSVVGSSVAAAAGAVSAAGGAAAGPSLDVQTASMKLQCIDQLDKAEPPQIPETYIFLLALQCLSALADGFASFTLATYGDVIARRQTTRGLAPPALDWNHLDARDPQVASLRVVRSMAESAWPALLASMSFFIATALSDDLFSDVVTSLQNFTSVLGVLNLETPREAFLTSLCKFAMPPAVVSHIASQQDPFSSHASKPSSAAAAATAVLSAGAESLALLASGSSSASFPVGLSSRNLACLRALMSVAHYLAGSLGYSWFCVFETLQNADFVIRATSAWKSAKKRTQAPSTAAHATPSKGGTGGTAAGQPASSDQAALPVVPSEVDELAVQQAISKLFEVSSNLDDSAFRQFLGALCRLSGEMIGLQMSEDGAVAQYAGGDDRSEDGSTGTTTPLDTPDRSRRRSSGISTSRGASTKGGDKSFGIAKLGAVALLNVLRLVQRPPHVGWELLTSHLLFVLHSTSTSTPIRLQAADVLGAVLTAAVKALSASDLASDVDLQERGQTQVLDALAAQAEPAPRLQLAPDVEIRRLALDTLLKILEANGHSLITGWTQIFHILRTACPTASFFAPPSPVVPSAPRRSLDTITEHDGVGPMTPMRSSLGANGYFNLCVDGGAKNAKSAVLVRTSFPSLQLICTDFLDALEVAELRDCITTLSEFGKQAEDVNVALTAGGLIWGVSDHVQAKRKQGDSEAAHGELWMFLLHNLLVLCRDSRQEVRDAAITNVFRSISMYGSTLDDTTWDACCWEIILPLVDDITSTIRRRNDPGAAGDEDLSEETVPQPDAPPIRLVDKQWDESLTLALRYLGDVFFDYLSQLVKVDRYDEIWAAFVDRTKESYIRDRPVPATAAMQALERVLTVSLDMSAAERIGKSWEVAWKAWDDVGTAIEDNARAGSDEEKFYTQVNLEAFVRVALPIYTPPHITFDLGRIQRLLAILKTALTYQRSPDYRADVDGLMPLQSAVLEVVAVIKLDDIPGAASAVLSDLSEYLKLAFVAPFETSPPSGMGGGQRVTYVALAKEIMPHVQWLYRKYSDESSVYEQGAVERMLQAYTLPMRLKHDCPAPAKFGSAEPLWKTATVNYLKAVRDVVTALGTLDLPSQTEEAIWTQLVEGFAEALLASSRDSATQRGADLHREEEFDLALLASLEHDVLPHLGSPRVPDDLVRRLAKALQLASRLYRLDLPDPSADAHIEPRFILDFDEQVEGEMFGTTVEIVDNRKERFAYWCLDMLFLICGGDKASGPARQRLAALSVPSLLNRCAAIIKTYVIDAPLRGKMPFPRIRQEELIYVLQRLSALRLVPNTLWASAQPSPSSAIASPTPLSSTSPRELVRDAMLRSPLAHLYELHGLLTDLLEVARNEPSIVQAYMPQRFAVGLRNEDDDGEWEGLPAGCKVGIVGRRRRGGAGQDEDEMDVAKLTLRCLRLVGEEIGAGLSFA
ncbi:Endocytosis and vacuole integrity protein [Rhodotorula toruloides]